jgi:predicted transcriptional regulator
MPAATDLLDKWKKTRSLVSDNASAGILGVKRQTISGWRNGDTRPEADTIARMAEEIGEDAGYWMVRIEAERARSPQAAKAWGELARRLGASTLLTLLTICALASPADVSANSCGSRNDDSAYYVK